jgi:hypothetical protein
LLEEREGRLITEKQFSQQMLRQHQTLAGTPPISDLNELEIADLMSRFLKARGLN